MISLMKFFDAITSLFQVDPVRGKEAAIASLDPEKIYLENVRSVLGVSTTAARRICDTAVRRGLFQSRVEVVCPDGTVAKVADSEDELPETLNCWVEQGGEFSQVEHRTEALTKVVFYRFNG